MCNYDTRPTDGNFRDPYLHGTGTWRLTDVCDTIFYIRCFENYVFLWEIKEMNIISVFLYKKNILWLQLFGPFVDLD